MKAAAIACSQCRIPLQQTGAMACPNCGASLIVEIFPALFRQLEQGKAPEMVLTEGESVCFYHATKKAVVPCDSCGRFLCALCDIDLNGEHHCPVCLESGRAKGKLQNLENRRTLYDQIALTLSIAPLLLCAWPSLVAAPIALFISLRYRNRPTSVVRKSKVRFTVATILSSLQILGWIAVFIYWSQN